MSRSALLTIVVAALIGGGLAVRTVRPLPEVEAPVPTGQIRYDCEGCNVLLISIDTLRADRLSCYGNDRLTSPFLDRFAAGGLLFENAISQASWTMPAHASMMTGLLPEEHGLFMHPNPGRLTREHPTMATLLKKHGYKTVSFNGGGYLRPDLGLGLGFQTYESYSRDFGKNLAAARKWLVQNDEKKFFMFLHGFDVHHPYKYSNENTMHELWTRYDIETFCREAENNTHPRAGEELEYILSRYDAGISYVDRLFEQFFHFLQKRDLLRNTMIIITSDHGDEFFEHGYCGHAGTVYRELAHVPLIVWIPGGPAERIEEPVAASISLLPTIASTLKLDLEADPTFDLMRVARGENEGHDFVITETGYVSKATVAGSSKPVTYRKGVSTFDWKMIYSMAKGEEIVELYDVRTDVLESENVAAEHPEVVTRMKQRLFPDGMPEVTSAAPAVEMDPKTLEQLKALGYLDAD